MKRILFTLFILISISTYSQQLSPEVIASAGDHFENDYGISLSWTLGEPVISTLTGEYILTQGFHQDLYIITAIDEIQLTNVKISIYPNPTPDVLHISIINQTDGNVKTEIQLFDLSGHLLLNKNDLGNNADIELDLNALSRSHYILNIISNGQLKSYKIIKT